ncbi:hypothetical protein AAEP93_007271 [Penicillium crustosum]
MTINNDYQLWLFRDVDFQEMSPNFTKTPLPEIWSKPEKEPHSLHQLQFLMWTFMQQIDVMSEVRDQILVKHGWTLDSTLRCREL